jgi:hypothetical protein
MRPRADSGGPLGRAICARGCCGGCPPRQGHSTGRVGGSGGKAGGRRYAVSRRATLAALPLLGACALPRAGGGPAACPGGERFHLYASDWHSEVAVPIDWLAELAPFAPGAAWVMLGFGQRDFFMADRPGVAEALGAVVPSPAVIRAQFLAAPPVAGGDVEVLALRGARAPLASFLAASFAREGDGRLAPPLRAGLPGRAFLPAARRYSLAYTCNTWTADALAAAGLPVSSTGVVRREHVMGQARALSCT